MSYVDKLHFVALGLNCTSLLINVFVLLRLAIVSDRAFASLDRRVNRIKMFRRGLSSLKRAKP